MNEHLPYRNWFQRNKIWIIFIVILVVVLFYILPKDFKVGAMHMLIAYSDTEIVDSAISITNKNKRIKEILGDIQPMTKMTMLEGYVTYSKNIDSVFMALTIKGSKGKGKGKLDIYAFKKNNKWEFERLLVRLKEPKFRKESIPISIPADLRKQPLE